MLGSVQRALRQDPIVRANTSGVSLASTRWPGRCTLKKTSSNSRDLTRSHKKNQAQGTNRNPPDPR
eukprot:1144036-Pelagomonas_calceolata.AAC.1